MALSTLQAPTLEDAGFPYQASNPDFLDAGATLSMSESKFIAYSTFFRAERRERRSRPPDADSGRRRISISSVKLRRFWSGSHASRFQVEFHRVFPGFSALNGESGALDPPHATLGDTGFPYQFSNSDFLEAGATLPVSKSKSIAYSQVFQRRTARAALSPSKPSTGSGRDADSIVLP